MSVRSELRSAVIERSAGRCEWPQHSDHPGAELAHLHSIGAGGRKSADTISNVAWLCSDHALMSDGLHGSGGGAQYREEHLVLFGDRFLDMAAHVVGWERAEALRQHIEGLWGETTR